MELIIRAAVVYFVLLFIIRASGNRQLSEMTAFDIVLLIIVAEVTQQALTGDDRSITGAIVLIVTLVGIDILISLAKQRSRRAERLFDGVPVLLVDDGNVLEDNLRAERVDRADILEAAREKHGLERLDQVKYAVLERDGKISIIPRAG